MIGEKIYVESVLSDEEYREYGNKFGQSTVKPAFFNSEVKWRYRMGAGLTPSEIELINKRMDQMRKKVSA